MNEQQKIIAIKVSTLAIQDIPKGFVEHGEEIWEAFKLGIEFQKLEQLNAYKNTKRPE